jgi:hypothetical protein
MAVASHILNIFGSSPFRRPNCFAVFEQVFKSLFKLMSHWRFTLSLSLALKFREGLDLGRLTARPLGAGKEPTVGFWSGICKKGVLDWPDTSAA